MNKELILHTVVFLGLLLFGYYVGSVIQTLTKEKEEPIKQIYAREWHTDKGSIYRLFDNGKLCYLGIMEGEQFINCEDVQTKEL